LIIAFKMNAAGANSNLMLVLAWILGILASVAAICAIPWLCALLVRGLFHHWRNAASGGSAFNPLLEFVQPRARHVIEVQQQRLKQDDEGSPPDPRRQAIDRRPSDDGNRI
jgi:hypothetical protein